MRILILGAGVMQGPAIEIANNMGWQSIVVDGDAQAANRHLAHHFEAIDLKDSDSLVALGRHYHIDGVFTAGTDFSLSVAIVAQALGLPGIPIEVALNASNKAQMRHCFEKAGIPSPKYSVLDSLEFDINTLPPFPLVIKPVDSMGARGCKKVSSTEGLIAALKAAFPHSRSGKVIAEEFIEGPEFSIDSLVFDGQLHVCGFADRHIFYQPYFIEMGHTLPSNIAKPEENKIIDIFTQAVSALGINYGAAKGDIKLSPQGPVIGEIAARLSGGFMSGWTFPLASGVELTKAALELAVGRRPTNLKPNLTNTSAERAFISIPGNIKDILGLEAAGQRAHIQKVYCRVKKDQEVNFPTDNVSKAGNIIATAPNRAAAVSASEEAAASILLPLSFPHSRTASFLAGPLGHKAFPPPAFSLPSAIQAFLENKNNYPNALSAQELNRLALPDYSILNDFISPNSAFKDYQGRTAFWVLELLRSYTGLPLKVEGQNGEFASFWRALARGSWQGGLYWLNAIGFSKTDSSL